MLLLLGVGVASGDVSSRLKVFRTNGESLSSFVCGDLQDGWTLDLGGDTFDATIEAALSTEKEVAFVELYLRNGCSSSVYRRESVTPYFLYGDKNGVLYSPAASQRIEACLAPYDMTVKVTTVAGDVFQNDFSFFVADSGSGGPRCFDDITETPASTLSPELLTATPSSAPTTLSAELLTASPTSGPAVSAELLTASPTSGPTITSSSSSMAKVVVFRADGVSLAVEECELKNGGTLNLGGARAQGYEASLEARLTDPARKLRFKLKGGCGKDYKKSEGRLPYTLYGDYQGVYEQAPTASTALEACPSAKYDLELVIETFDGLMITENVDFFVTDTGYGGFSCQQPEAVLPVVVTTQTPTTEAPTTEAPTTQAPTTQAPTTTSLFDDEASATLAPTTQAPTTTTPTTTTPMTTPTTTPTTTIPTMTPLSEEALAVEACDGAYFREDEGLVVMEVESFPLVDGWVKNTSYGATYYEWAGDDSFGKVGVGTTSQRVQVTTNGTYLVKWRSRINIGEDSTEHNDNWLRVTGDGVTFFGEQQNGSKICPRGGDLYGCPFEKIPEGASGRGWFKIYQNTLGAWSWKTATSDNDDHHVLVDVSQPTTLTVEISGRSSGHAIDRIVLKRMPTYGINTIDDAVKDVRRAAQDLDLQETTCYNHSYFFP